MVRLPILICLDYLFYGLVGYFVFLGNWTALAGPRKAFVGGVGVVVRKCCKS